MGEDGTRRRAPLRLVPGVLLACLLLAAAPSPVTKEVSPAIAMPVLGRTVFSPAGDTVGRIVDVLVDAAGLPQAAVLDVGGFMGVGNRIIAVHWAALRFHPTDKDHPITIDMPADEIAAAPQYTDTTAPAQVVVPHATPPVPSAPIVAHPPEPDTTATRQATPAPPPPAPPQTTPAPGLPPGPPPGSPPGPAPPTPPVPTPAGAPGTGK